MNDLNNIIKRCADGNERAQAEIYRLFAPKMFGVCLRYAKDRTEAEDNLQEGFVKVFTYIKKFRGEGSFEGWVRKIMVHASLEKYRKHHLLYPVENIMEYEKEGTPSEVLDKMSADELLALVQELSPQYRMVFNLYVMEGMSHSEISKELGISIGTSKSNLARARDILKGKVIKLYGSEENKANHLA